jgi:hypothetical protein
MPVNGRRRASSRVLPRARAGSVTLCSAEGGRVAWFRRATKPETAGGEPPAPDEPIESTDTVGNPIIERRRGRHAADRAPEDVPTLPTRAEHRMLQLVAEGRIARTTTGGAAGAFWRVDGAFATGTKAMMLDWLLQQSFIAEGRHGRVAAEAVLTEHGRAVLDLHAEPGEPPGARR